MGAWRSIGDHSAFPLLEGTALNGIGNFDSLRGADVFWSIERRWQILPKGNWPTFGTSLHDMR